MLRFAPVPAASLAESNLFLRALWATLRERFGSMSWQYTPRKYGPQQCIRLGWMALGGGSHDMIEVTVRYGRIGVIRAIEFQAHPDAAGLGDQLAGDLRRCVEQAIGRTARPKSIEQVVQVTSQPGFALGYYQGADWYCGPLTNGNTEIGIYVKAFDDADARHEFQVKIAALIDVLSALTNVVFDTTRDTDGEPASSSSELNVFLEDKGWLDDFPLEGETLRLSAKAMEFCNAIVAGSVEDRLLRSASLFHKALALHRKLPQCGDVATALFMSALEALPPQSKPETCSTCGQPIYKISKRVVDLAVSHLGEGLERIFKDQYAKRSQYLHAGVVRSSQPLPRRIIPQLDPNAPEGCAMPWPTGGPDNLLEYASFVIRREMLGPVMEDTPCARIWSGEGTKQ